MKKAILWNEFKKEYADGTFVQLVIWLVPVSKNHPHGLKYRLHFGTTDGICLVRFDNKVGKGDHKHIKNKQFSYEFTTPEKLLQDFWNDVAKSRGNKHEK